MCIKKKPWCRFFLRFQSLCVEIARIQITVRSFWIHLIIYLFRFSCLEEETYIITYITISPFISINLPITILFPYHHYKIRKKIKSATFQTKNPQHFEHKIGNILGERKSAKLVGLPEVYVEDADGDEDGQRHKDHREQQIFT